MKYPKRVHVAPVGFEIDRVVLPFIEMDGERIHLIVRKGRNERGDKCVKAICEELDRRKQPYKIYETELDLFRLIYTCRKIIDEELRAGNHVFVNMSSGGSMHAVACHFATLTFKEGVSAYYAYPERYNERVDPDRPEASSGFSKIQTVPHHSIEMPSEDEFKVLFIIMKSKIPSKKAILEDCIAANLITGEGKSKPYGHVVLETRFLRPMEEQGLILVEGKGRKSRVRITEKGINTLHLNGWFENSP
jgi:hypothetical protein